jgi:hypothetical protein
MHCCARSFSPRIVPALFFLACSATELHAQTDSSSAPALNTIELRPTFSMGAGMLAFYGDIGSRQNDQSPLVTRFGYELRAATPVFPWLEAGLYALHGRVGANERSLARNLNFESRVTIGGFQLSYNFLHLLDPDRTVEPFVLTGFESLEFLSKTDLRDAQGRTYHYWDDGTIRDAAQDGPNAGQASLLRRDYVYETDVRESNPDGLGKYTERTFAIPVGIGARMRLPKGFDLRLTATMHFSLSDRIDGVTDASINGRQGDALNDRFLFTSAALGFALPSKKKNAGKEPELSPEEIDLIVFGDDEDTDGVTDLNDLSAHTPTGVTVDGNGRPVDNDLDLVADYADDELTSAANSPVDMRGVTLSDSAFLQAYLAWKDSLRNVETSRVESTGKVVVPVVRPRKAKNYVVQVGSHTEGISEEMVGKLLSIPGVRTIERGDSTYYVVDGAEELPAAIRMQLNLEQKGIAGKVVAEQNGVLTNVDDEVAKAKQAMALGTDSLATSTTEPSSSDEAVIRVQLGAFRQKLSRNVFTDVKDLVVITGEDGLTRYYSGSFNDLNAAAQHKVDMLVGGFKGAFLVAFKGGKRISLKETGARLLAPESESTVPPAGFDKNLVTFRVQVGTFAGNVPAETMGTYIDLGSVTPVPSTNAVRYFYGRYPSRAAAEEARKEVQYLGLTDAFVVGDVAGRIVPAEDAERLLTEQ